MKNEDRRLAVELGIIALILAMGVASMINAGNIRMHLEIFEWSNNMTALDPEIRTEFQEKGNTVTIEMIFGAVFIAGGFLGLIGLLFKYRKKSDDAKKQT